MLSIIFWMVVAIFAEQVSSEQRIVEVHDYLEMIDNQNKSLDKFELNSFKYIENVSLFNILIFLSFYQTYIDTVLI